MSIRLPRNQTCAKCGDKIPTRITVNGKTHIISNNRIFCLQCSPYGKHNTSKDPRPDRPNKVTTPYANWPEEWKKSSRGGIRRRGIERKAKLVEMAGGKCSICGYNRNIKALVFHHYQGEKMFGMNQQELASHSWDTIMIEFAKCQLLCHNCHTEVHDQILNGAAGT